MKRTTGIDIIIPVYNALADLKKCVESIRRHTDLDVDRLILIDDRSPDPAVYPYMQSITQAGIVVLQNQENLGFSGTVNRGLMYSDRDVILLNSDTIVTEKWADKIVTCAYSDPAIGTVTPFSNNATLCSVPNFCQENEVPYGLSIDEYAGIIARSSLKKYPRITVAVGFCMFIKREVVEQVGLFDAETFQRGYGEENDFCWRAEQLGYHHVLCDDTYIYHSGSSSFVSDEKKKLMADHEKILQDRYPIQIQKNAQYVRDNPHQYLRDNADIYARLANGRKNILYMLHADFRADASNNIGGTQFHVKDLVEHGRKAHNVFVLARDNQMLRLTIYLEQEQISFAFRVETEADFQSFRNESVAQVLRQVLAAFAIDLVHVHHVHGVSFDIFFVAKEMGIPVMLTMHDFYYVCPTVKLLEKGAVYCRGEGGDCAACLYHELGFASQVAYLPLWRERCRQALGICDALIVPSDAVKRIYASVYPEFAGRIRVIPHGMDAFAVYPAAFDPATPEVECCVEHAFVRDYDISGWAILKGADCRSNEVFVRLEDTDGHFVQFRARSVNRADVAQARANEQYAYSGFSVQIPDGCFATGVLKLQLVIRNADGEYYGPVMTVKGYKQREKKRRRIAFLGGLNTAKGSQTACRMIKQSGNKYDWYIIGGIGDPELNDMERGNVFKTDWYQRENVGAILQYNRIDMVCILPICPETFCYTLSEAQLAGVPTLVTDIGALGDRMRQDGTGWVVDANATEKQILDRIDGIFADEAGYQNVRDMVKAFRHKTIAQMYEDYAQLYRTAALPENRQTRFDPRVIYKAYALCRAEQSGYGMVADVELLQRVQELETTLSTIQGSLSYRILHTLKGKKIPFKRQLKALAGGMYRLYRKCKGKK